ncbi:helix-turn-helix domain-containing protein [Natrialba asiatica]|uniref:MarR family transcriptional regulator n=1 Tax=Natrialba asiatica (strain ATCC 700177 / DSM 12278 / JCM 9576 / FERM P-10747 / NBRC 102637 / 172P1) TaxID=29540 RepID=M0AUL7_NATA1|nr:helix-turn-helix domain-containing protein [Natrialba asiatica]ELZ02401.1 MarR family transcriptional regulator [Natrialba asiatica DSM 12278]
MTSSAPVPVRPSTQAVVCVVTAVILCSGVAGIAGVAAGTASSAETLSGADNGQEVGSDGTAAVDETEPASDGSNDSVATETETRHINSADGRTNASGEATAATASEREAAAEDVTEGEYESDSEGALTAGSGIISPDTAGIDPESGDRSEADTAGGERRDGTFDEGAASETKTATETPRVPASETVVDAAATETHRLADETDALDSHAELEATIGGDTDLPATGELEFGAGTVTDPVTAVGSERAEPSREALPLAARIEGESSLASGGVVTFGDGSDGNETAGESADGERGDGSETADSETASPRLPSSTTETALIGLLGVITASGVTAGTAGLGAGLGTGTGAGVGASAGASSSAAGTGIVTTVANAITTWVRQIELFQRLHRLASRLPWQLVSIFRYSRYDDSDPLENDRRRTVYETIRADPGCYLSQVRDRNELSLSTVRHHLRILEEEGLVSSAKIGGKRRLYLEAAATGTEHAATNPDDREAGADGTLAADSPRVELQAALAEPAKRDVLETLAAIGQANNGRLADELECDPSTVSHHLSALEADELIVRERDGRAVVNRLAADVEATLTESERSRSGETDRSARSPADD